MANYSVDIDIALKGAEKIKNLRKETQGLNRDVNKFNREINKNMGMKKGSVVNNFNNLSKEVTRARTVLNKAAIDTKAFDDAVKNVVKVEEEFNKELKKRDRALKVQREAQRQGISLKKASILLTKKEAEDMCKAPLKKEDISEKEQPIFDDLVGYAIKYFNDVIKTKKKYKTPDQKEKKALEALIKTLDECNDKMSPEDIQTLIYSTGKDNGYSENLRDWFRLIYEVVFGDENGPRMGFFISFFGVKETKDLILNKIK